MNDPTKRMSAPPQLALTVRRSSPLVAVLLLACACATPVGATHVDTQSMYRSLTSSVLSADRPSQYSVIATPHRGSFRVSSLVLGLARRLVTLPLTVVGGITELTAKNMGLPREAAPTAVDNMLPTNRFVRTLSASSIAPGVTAHSIIPVKATGLPKGQDDGVVKYVSAHLEGIASEKIVRSTHSTQSTPATILEVRRILYEHLGIACGLECEVPERVDAAVAGTPKPEPPAVTTDPAPKP